MKRMMEVLQMRSRSISKVMVCLLTTMTVLSLTVRPTMAFEGTPSKIVVNGLASIDKSELLYLMGLETGKPVTGEEISQGIKRAFLKGIFEEISVETAKDAEDVIIVNVRERDFIIDVDIHGVGGSLKKYVRERLGIHEGEELKYGLLSEEKRKLEGLLSDKGYPDAVIGFRVFRTDEPYRVELVVNVDASTPVIIDKIEICGDEWVRDRVRGMIGLSVGSIYDQIVLQEKVNKIREWLKDMWYIEPVVGPYTFDNGVLEMCVYPGRKLEIAIDGNSFISNSDLKKTMLFIESGEVNEGLIAESVDRMYMLYREKGFVDTQIAPFFSDSRKAASVSYFIFEGRRAIVNSVSITGSDIPEKRLRELLSLKPGEPYDPDHVDSDSRRLRDFFIALGYSDAEVEDADVVLEDVPWWKQDQDPKFEGFDRAASITLTVIPGPQILISNLEVVGTREVSPEEIKRASGLKEGDPYNEVDISDALRRARNSCRSYGFYYCSVDVERQVSEHGLELIFHVQEGRRLLIGKTIVRGNFDTNLKVIGREIEYREGQPLVRTDLEQTRRKLYKLRLFSRVDVEAVESDKEKNDVLINLQEGKAGTVEFGFGYGEYELYRGFLDISYRNLFGMNREGSIRTEFSSLSSRYIATYLEPWFFGRRVVSKTFLLHESRKEKNIDTGEILYRIKKYTASTGLEKELTKHIKGTLYYEYSIVDTFDIQPDVILSREDTGTLAISSLSPGVVYDTRDDPFDPTSGVFAGLTIKYASYLLFSETDFIKTTGQLSGYHGLTRRLVLAASARGGAAHGFNGTEELPLVERFFLGGRSTVRGYDQDTLGPKGEEGTPVGGNFFILGNVELRYRLTGNWRVVTFMDGGNVWILENDVTVNDLKYTAGLGLQYNTPVGPFRLDYGHKLNRAEGESEGEFHFSLGHAF